MLCACEWTFYIIYSFHGNFPQVLLGCLCVCSVLAVTAPQSEYRALNIETQEVKIEPQSNIDIVFNTIMNNLPSFMQLFYKVRNCLFSNYDSFDFNQTKSLIMDVVNTVITVTNIFQEKDSKHSQEDLRKVEEIVSLFLSLLRVTNSPKQSNTNKTFIKDYISLTTGLDDTADRSSAPLQASSVLVDVLQDPQDSPAVSASSPDQAFPAPTSRPRVKEALSQMEANLTTTMPPQVSALHTHTRAPKDRYFYQKEEYERLHQIPRQYAKYPGYFIRLQK